jgi:endo-1,4-beta-mannosidase
VVTQPFMTGVNYWPRHKAMYWWSSFDSGEVHEEFSLIHELGMNMVRIFLLWDDFQPTSDRISSSSLDHLVTVCDIAADLDLQLNITFFTGNMSGPNWSPRWLLNGIPRPGARQLVSAGKLVQRGYRNPYSDPIALNAERLLLRTLVGALKDHPAIGIWDLGNEPDNFARPPSAQAGWGWVREMTTLIHNIDPLHPVTCGLHIASLLENNGLRIDQVFEVTDIAVMHAYPMYLDWARTPLDPEIAPFTCALVAALCNRPVLMEEFGGCTAPPGKPSFDWEWNGYGMQHKQFMANEDELAAYLSVVLPRLVEVGATGALIWCFADYIPELWDRPPCSEYRHERFFGLVRPDGSLKPHAQVVKDFASAHPTISPATKQLHLPFTAEEFYQDPRKATIALYQEWLDI